MVKVHYLGIGDPVPVFEKFRPVREELVLLQRRCFPFRADYDALAVAIRGLDVAAIHFTKNPHFYVPEYKMPRFQKDQEPYPRG